MRFVSSFRTLDLTNKAKVNELMDRVAKVYKEIKKSAKSEDEIRKDLCGKICSASPDVKVVVCILSSFCH